MLTQQQINNRKSGIGASEAAIVMGLNDNFTPYQLWMIKTGQMEPKDISDLPPVYWGNIHEETVAQEYAKRMGCKVRSVSKTLRHKDYSHILCHLDRKITGQNKLLECKFSMGFQDVWGDSGSDEVPLSYMIQVQHQLAVTGWDEGDLAVLIKGYDFRVYHFKRDEEVIAMIIKELNEFWDCVKTGNPPPIKNRVDASLAFPVSDPNCVKVADNEIKSIMQSLKDLRKDLKTREKHKSELETKLTAYMGEAEVLKADDGVLATWKSNARGSRVLRIME